MFNLRTNRTGRSLIAMLVALMAGAVARGATLFPANLNFCGESDGTALRQAIAVGSSQAGGTFTAQPTVSWINVSPSGLLNSVTTVGVDTSALTADTHTGSINFIGSDGSTATATVTVQLFPAGASVACPTSTLEPFSYKVGAPAPAPQILLIGGSGTFTVQFNTGSWLEVATNGSAPGVLEFGVNTAIAGTLANGQHTEMVSLLSPGGTATFPIVLNVVESTVEVMPGALEINVAPSQPPSSHTIELQSDPSAQITLILDSNRDCLFGASPLSGTTPFQLTLAPQSLATPQTCYSGLFGSVRSSTSPLFFIPVTVNVTSNPINLVPSSIQSM